MIEVIHEVEYGGCGKLAFTYLGEGAPEQLLSKDFLYPTGKHPIPGSIMRCGTCGLRFTPRREQLEGAADAQNGST